MNKKVISLFLLFGMLIVLGLLAACESGPWIVTITPTFETPTPECVVWPCASDSLTLTAARAIDYTATAAAASATPTCMWPCESDSLTLTADASITVRPQTGDLGWGAVYGKITDATTGLSVANAKIVCAHTSQLASANGRCWQTTWTNDDGIYSFVPVNLFDTDVIVLLVDAPGYRHFEYRGTAFTAARLNVDIVLEPIETGTVSSTPTVYLTPTP